MRTQIIDQILNKLGAVDLKKTQSIQSLWSNYGEIYKADLIFPDDTLKVVIKDIYPPSEMEHPRGWNTDVSHQRKLKSYQVEENWYKDYSKRCDETCKVPKLYTSLSDDHRSVFILEDLDFSGLELRKSKLLPEEAKLCLKWLANFHAQFMGTPAHELWKKGSYWHLDTRQEEWEQMPSSELKKHAKTLDNKLDNAKFKTLVHGDAKLANFCFTQDMSNVAAVDFQYVGSGCGIKDVVYFMGSCLSSDECEKHASTLLNYYFSKLKTSLEERNFQENFKELEQEWRSLYPIAWTDFTRFLMGWMPGHQKINAYSLKLMEEALSQI